MKKVDIFEDLSKLTTIPKMTLQKIEKRKQECIAHSVLESLLDSSDTTCVTMGIGDLYIKTSVDAIEYKFVPSNEFENTLVKTVRKRESPIAEAVDESLVQKVTQAYKDLF